MCLKVKSYELRREGYLKTVCFQTEKTNSKRYYKPDQISHSVRDDEIIGIVLKQKSPALRSEPDFLLLSKFGSLIGQRQAPQMHDVRENGRAQFREFDVFYAVISTGFFNDLAYFRVMHVRDLRK